jgi:penicillin G amidase
MHFHLILRRTLSLLMLLALLLGATGAASASNAANNTPFKLKGQHGPIIIARDDAGVPHIHATNEADAQFGLGYVHAQDRLWQLEWQRRLASGRTAEFLGPDGLPLDRLFRVVGLRRVAEATWANLSPAERAPLNAYAAGINAYLQKLPQEQLPPEFGILQITPEPWSPVDSLAFLKLFVWGNGSNWDKELLRGQLAAVVGPTRAAQLTPAYTADGPLTVEAGVEGQGVATSSQQAASQTQQTASSICNLQSAICADLLKLHSTIVERTGIGADGRGSNAWAISGKRTTTGKPLLANDPHLAAQSPAFWYLAELSYDGHRVIGATVPGGPSVQIGHNRYISWGVTTLNADGQDLYVEQINANNEALYQGQWEPLQVLTETIAVKGQAPLALTVRISRHGPLISDAVNPTGPAIAVRWTGSEPIDQGALVSLAINRARNWKAFTQAIETYRAPNMNYVYADRRGNIGYVAAGTVPIRAKGDGSVPSLGWTGEYEWQGYVPQAELPRSFNPPAGFVATANNKAIGDPYPYAIGNSFSAPYRVARVREMIQAKPKLSPGDVATMQADVLAVHARELMPLLLQTRALDAQSEQALALLRAWDFRTTGDSAAAAVFEAWYIRLGRALFADELTDANGGEQLWRDYGRNINFVGMALPVALRENQPWCDNVKTPVTESCADTLAQALRDGLTEMAQAQGTSDIAAWRWDKVHVAQFAHQPLGANPQLGPRFNRAVPNSGDRFTVNVAASFRRWEDYAQLHAPQYRQIVDWKRLRQSQWLVAPGQSGLPDSPRYDDMLERWQQVEYLPMR